MFEPEQKIEERHDQWLVYKLENGRLHHVYGEGWGDTTLETMLFLMRKIHLIMTGWLPNERMN